MSPIRRTRVLTFLLLLSISLAGGCQQGGWVDVESGPPAPRMKWRFLNAPLHDIWTPDGRQLWAVGSGGVVIHSSDGGRNWRLQENVDVDFLHALHGTTDGQKIWAVGSGGILIRTNNGGHSWSTTKLKVNLPIIEIHVNADGRTLRAFDIHGQEYLSLDGGETWAQPLNQPLRTLLKAENTTGDYEPNLHDIKISGDGESIFAVGLEGFFAFSSDRGKHWGLQRLKGRPSLFKLETSQDGSKLLVYGALTNSTVAHIWTGIADPASKSWLLQGPKPTSDERLTALFMDPQDRAWVATSAGRVSVGSWLSGPWESRDPSLGYSWRFAAAGEEALWAVGTGNLGTRVIRSTDQGATWRSQTIKLEPVAVARDSNSLWIYGRSGQLAHCTPECSLLKLPINNRRFLGNVGISNEQPWIVEGDALLTSEDSGTTWRVQKIPEATLLVDRFSSKGGDWLLDQSGQLFFSPQSGAGWNLHSSLPFTSPTTSAADLLGFDRENGFALFVLDNAGGLWRERSPKEWIKIYDSEQLFTSIEATPDGNNLWITGGILNALAYSADLGRNWNKDPHSIRMSFTSASVSPNGSSVLAVGQGSVLLGQAKGTYPRILKTRLRTDPSDAFTARLELRIEGSPDAATLRCGSKRDSALGQLSKVNSTLIRPASESGIWVIKFNPGSQDLGLKPGENLYAEVTLETKRASRGGKLERESPVFRQSFSIPPLPYEPWWQQPYILPLAGLFLWWLILVALLIAWPTSIVGLQHALRVTNLFHLLAEIPYVGSTAKLIGEASGLPLLARTSRALDAWVRMHQDLVYQRFEDEETVLRSDGYIPLPIRIGNQLFDRPEARFLSRFTLRHPTLIQIVGIGGAGKTTLAIQIARWAIAGKKEGGLERKPMLPVLVDEDTEDLRALVKRKLTSWLQEEISDDLLNALLRKQRILVIVDRVSERDSSTREHLRTLHGTQPINALIVTTRQALDFEAGGAVLVYPQPLGSETLLHFMTSLLQDPARSGAFQTMKGQIDLAQKLADLIRLGDEEIPLTPLLARLYVDKAVERAKAGASLDDLPQSIPDVYFDYLRSVNPPGGMSDPDMLNAAEVLAELALEKGFVPHEIVRSEAQKALAAAGWKEPGEPDSILRRLRDNGVLLETSVGTEVLLRFALDPIAEFLAASAHAKRCGESLSAWKTLVLKIDQAGEQAAGFRLALRLVCEAYGQRLGWACSEVAGRLTQGPPLP